MAYIYVYATDSLISHSWNNNNGQKDAQYYLNALTFAFIPFIFNIYSKHPQVGYIYVYVCMCVVI